MTDYLQRLLQRAKPPSPGGQAATAPLVPFVSTRTAADEFSDPFDTTTEDLPDASPSVSQMPAAPPVVAPSFGERFWPAEARPDPIPASVDVRQTEPQPMVSSPVVSPSADPTPPSVCREPLPVEILESELRPVDPAPTDPPTTPTIAIERETTTAVASRSEPAIAPAAEIGLPQPAADEPISPVTPTEIVERVIETLTADPPPVAAPAPEPDRLPPQVVPAPEPIPTLHPAVPQALPPRPPSTERPRVEIGRLHVEVVPPPPPAPAVPGTPPASSSRSHSQPRGAPNSKLRFGLGQL